MSSSLLARTASATIITIAVAAVALGAPAPAALAASPASISTLRFGTGLGATPSARVRRLQRILERRGLDLGPRGVDGRFGPFTTRAVERLQSRYGLVPDGIVGSKTRRLVSLLAVADATRRTRTPGPQSSPPAPSPKPPATTTPQPQSAPPPATAPAEPQSGPVVTGDRSSAGGTSLATILAALAALLAAAALLTALGRRRITGGDDPAPAIAAIDRDLYLEGRSDRPEVGAFRGFAVATAVPPGAMDDPREARYLVDDPRKSAPVWIRGGEISRSPSQLGAGELVIGYVTADADPAREQEAFMAIEAACEQTGWNLQEVIREPDSGRLVGRPGLTDALERIAAGHVRGLVVSDSHSVARSLRDLGALLDWFRDAEAAFVALDLDLDTATIDGHQTAGALIAVAGWEGERAASRARRGLVRVPAPGQGGAPTPEARAALAERLDALREAGMSLEAIADQLGREGVAPPRGGAGGWSPATVSEVLDRPRRREDVRAGLPPIPSRDRGA
jgi:DNA invertase Pin-like site-specific DNA recombinase/peptidoglycan hydrolase-like protein with peptidoglycan-binding domain